MKEIEYHNKYIFAIITLEKWSEYKNILTYTMFIAARCCCVIVVVLLSGVCVTNPGDQRPAPAPMLLVSADGRHKCGRKQLQPGPGSFCAILGGDLLVLISSVTIYSFSSVYLPRIVLPESPAAGHSDSISPPCPRARHFHKNVSLFRYTNLAF